MGESKTTWTASYWKHDYIKLSGMLNAFRERYLPNSDLIPTTKNTSGSVAKLLAYHLEWCEELLDAEIMNCDDQYIEEYLFMMRGNLNPLPVKEQP